MRLRFTPTARAQLLLATNYIKRDDPRAAKRFRERVQKTLRRLTRFPNSGRTLPEFPDLPFREVIVPPYRFFYRVKGEIVWVAAVWHGAHLPEPPVA